MLLGVCKTLSFLFTAARSLNNLLGVGGGVVVACNERQTFCRVDALFQSCGNICKAKKRGALYTRGEDCDNPLAAISTYVSFEQRCFCSCLGYVAVRFTPYSPPPYAQTSSTYICVLQRQKINQRTMDQTVAPTSFLWNAYSPSRYYYEASTPILEVPYKMWKNSPPSWLDE